MDTWTIIGYVLGVLLNVGVIGVAKIKAQSAGKQFMQSGRLVVVLVFVLCAVEKLLLSGFGVLDSAATITTWLQASWNLAAATMGTHIVGKTLLGGTEETE